MGRFISRDPIRYIGGGDNLFAAYFAPGSVDPSGLMEGIDPFSVKDILEVVADLTGINQPSTTLGYGMSTIYPFDVPRTILVPADFEGWSFDRYVREAMPGYYVEPWIYPTHIRFPNQLLVQERDLLWQERVVSTESDGPVWSVAALKKRRDDPPVLGGGVKIEFLCGKCAMTVRLYDKNDKVIAEGVTREDDGTYEFEISVRMTRQRFNRARVGKEIVDQAPWSMELVLQHSEYVTFTCLGPK